MFSKKLLVGCGFFIVLFLGKLSSLRLHAGLRQRNWWSTTKNSLLSELTKQAMGMTTNNQVAVEISLLPELIRKSRQFSSNQV